MINFKSNKISRGGDTLANVLKEARAEKKISLEDASRKLQINIDYLIALETGHFEKLPDGVYRKNFLREYTRLLEISYEELLPLFNSEANAEATPRNQDPFSRKIPQAHYFLTMPKLIKNLGIVFIALVCLLYLGFYIFNISRAPKLTILYPPESITTDKLAISLEGRAEPETEIAINEELVLQDPSGFFSKTINLTQGLNIITVTGRKKYSRSNTIIREIMVNLPDKNGP